MSLAEFNGVRSTIIDQGTPPPSITISRNRTFIFGTASRGPLYTPMNVNTENVQDIFGIVPNDASFDTSLVRGFYEYIDSSAGVPEIAMIRVGSVNAAKVDLYENTAHLSGDLSYTLTVDGTPEYSMWLRAIQEGAEYNRARVTVTEDDSTGQPSYLRIELPDTSSAGYNLSPSGGSAGVINKVSDLVNQINSNESFQGKVIAGFDPLEKTTAVTVTRTLVSGTVDTYTIDRTYDLTPSGVPLPTNQSWGDKMVGLTEVYQERDVEQLVEAGSTSVELDVVPDKDMTPGTQTIDTAIRVSGSESVLTVSPLTAGQSNVVADLYCKSVSGWDNAYSIYNGDVTLGEDPWTFQLLVKRNGTSSLVKLEYGTKYTVNTITGQVTILETLSVGDVYYATYRYKVSYAEAKLRSDLLSGDTRSYFIYGNTVIFGADQPVITYMYYNAKVQFTSDDVAIDDFDQSIITFINADNLPEHGVPLTVKVAYEPELPAATGKVLPGSVVQPGALTGGTDGRIMTKQQYVNAVKDAFQAVDLYPRRSLVIMGMYLDDIVDGYNEETGLPEQVPLNMHSAILPYVDRTSNLANECEVQIPVRPLTDLDQTSINTWIEKLTTNSDTDLNRPANLIDGINNFRGQSPLGVYIGAISNVNNGRRYFMNPACVYAAYKQNLAFDRAATHDFVPGNVKDLGVKIFNAEIIGKLNLKRYTTAVINYGGQFIWADAPTLAIKGRSQFDRQFVRDTVYLAVGMAREVAEKYIGKPRLAQYLMSMKKDVGKALASLAPDVLSDVFVDIVPLADGHITGKTKLRLMLVTAKEIRTVDIETSISLAQ